MFVFLVSVLIIVAGVFWAFWPLWGYVEVKKLVGEDHDLEVTLRKTRRLFAKPSEHVFVGQHNCSWYHKNTGTVADILFYSNIEHAVGFAVATGKIKYPEKM